MKKVYILNTYAMNGTVTMNSVSDIFLTKELAEKCKDALEKINEKNSREGFRIHSKIEEGNLFETEDDCECLKENKE